MLKTKQDNTLAYISGSKPEKEIFQFHNNNMPPPTFISSTKKYSYGVACIDISGEQPKILMIRKRSTYAFIEFVRGSYFGKGNVYLKNLLSKMTPDEKADIMRKDFAQIWYRAYGNNKRQSEYIFAQNKFENLILQNKELKKLIANSGYSQDIWEIPKGRKHTKEPEVCCAMREFCEETNIHKTKYTLIDHPPLSYSHTDDGVEYNNKYYIAVINEPVKLTININNDDQMNEVSMMSWMPIEVINWIDTTGCLYTFVREIFTIIRAYKKKLVAVPTNIN